MDTDFVNSGTQDEGPIGAGAGGPELNPAHCNLCPSFVHGICEALGLEKPSSKAGTMHYGRGPNTRNAQPTIPKDLLKHFLRWGLDVTVKERINGSSEAPTSIGPKRLLDAQMSDSFGI